VIKVTGLSEWLRELRAMQDGLDTASLDRAMREAFDDTQLKVHTLSGALKASGRVETRSDKKSWTGEITYGGTPSCDYAIYEERRGGAHDFLRGVPEYEDKLLAALDKAIAKP
jgi:hypothetical protein